MNKIWHAYGLWGSTKGDCKATAEVCALLRAILVYFLVSTLSKKYSLHITLEQVKYWQPAKKRKK